MSAALVTAAQSADAWRWQAHVEVWVLVLGIIGLGLYATRVIGPKVVPHGRPVVTRRQKGFFWAGLVLLWVASDWPIHDISEEYLFSIHMVQHLVLTMLVPPLFLLATPTWLARLIIPEGGTADRWMRRLTKPVVAGVLFNLTVAFTHIPAVVNASVETGPLHYAVHVLAVSAALLMWTPVCGPFPERRLSMPGQMLYLFLMSILPTVPAGWLTFAEGSVYDAYDTPFRLWGVSLASDQQAAGLVMKLVGGFYLWGIIFTMFVKWAKRHAEADAAGITASEREVLTWGDVQDEFRRVPPPEEPAISAPDTDPAVILEGKTVIITGVGPGLGGETARLALRDGANVALAARKADRLEAFAGELGEPDRVLAVATDITDAAACAALVEQAVDRFGGVDALAQVAARDAVMGTFADSSPDDFTACFETNVVGSLTAVEAVRPALDERGGGAVVLVGSQSAVLPVGPMPQIAYATSKGALQTATFHLADELGPERIRVNLVVPTWMWGPPVEMYVDWKSSEREVPRSQIVEEITDGMSLDEVPADEDVAEAIVWLCSDRARMVTGQTLMVNAGELKR